MSLSLFTTSCSVATGTAGLNGIIRCGEIVKPEPLPILAMGNAGSRGLGSAINHGTHISTTGGGKPIRYSPELIKEFKRTIIICEPKQELKEQVNYKSIFNHMWVVDDDKTVANTLTTSPKNSHYISDETVKETSK